MNVGDPTFLVNLKRQKNNKKYGDAAEGPVVPCILYNPMNSFLNGIDDPILFKNKSSILVLADSMGPKIARTD